MTSYGPGSQVRLSAALALPIVEALQYVEAECDQLLEDLGISLHHLAVPGARVTHAQWLSLLERATVLSGDLTFPLRAAEGLRAHTLGLGPLIAASKGTFGSHGGLAPIFRRQHEGLSIELDDLGHEVHCRFRFTAGLPGTPELTEYMLACISVVGRELLARLYVAPMEVHFRHAARTDVGPYEGLFGCTVKFAQNRTAIVFPSQNEIFPIFGTNPVK